MTKMHGSRLYLVTAAAVLALLVAPLSARAQISENAVKAQVSKAYGVTVLKVRRAEDDNGRAVFLVTVMNPGGDFNEAFQVNTLAVDATTGNLVPSYRQRASGVSPNQAPSYVPNRQPTNALESRAVVR